MVLEPRGGHVKHPPECPGRRWKRSAASKRPKRAAMRPECPKQTIKWPYRPAADPKNTHWHGLGATHGGKLLSPCPWTWGNTAAAWRQLLTELRVRGAPILWPPDSVGRPTKKMKFQSILNGHKAHSQPTHMPPGVRTGPGGGIWAGSGV